MEPRGKRYLETAAATTSGDAFFRALIEQTSELVSVLHADGTVAYASPSYCTLLGYAPEDLLGRSSFTLVHPDDLARVAASFAHVTEEHGRRASSGEYRMRHADGSWHTLITIGTNLLEDPSVNGVLVNARDVTAYNRTVALLAENRRLSEAQLAELELLYHSAPIGLALLDCELRFVRINDRLAGMIGIPPEKHIGLRPHDVLPKLGSTLERALRQVIETGVPMLDVEAHGSTAAAPGVARDWLLSSYRLDDLSGHPIGLNTVVQEITERKQSERDLARAREELESRVRERTADLEVANEALCAQIDERMRVEESLRQSEARYRHLVENITDVIFALDREGRITYISPTIERLTGHSPADLIGRLCLELIHPEDSAVLRQSYPRTLSGAPEPSEYRVIDRSGQERWMRSHSLPIFADGRVIGSQGVLTDISQRRSDEMQARRRQAELAHAQRLTTAGEMTAEIAHQINQPLAAIANFASGLALRLRLGQVESELATEIASRISAEALRAGEIIRQMRAFLRKGESAPQECDLNQLVANVYRLLEEDFRCEAIEVRLLLAPELPALFLNTVLIEQVVLNLLRNSLEAMAGGGPHRLEVTTEAFAESVRVSVCDSGTGLSPGTEHQVFEAFFTTKPDGLGLGLAVSRSIIDGCGGGLRLERNPDRGTTARFTLPL